MVKLLKTAVWCFAISLSIGQALGQGALLQGGPRTGGHAPMYIQSGSGNQTTVQDSGPAGGGAVGLGLSELLQVNRSATSSSGTGPNGEHNCFYSAPTTSSGYYYYCFDAFALGGGLISYGAVGSAAPHSLTMRINGTNYTFPFVASGIIGPSSSTVGNFACWNNTSGTLLSDCGLSTVRPALSSDLTVYVRTDGNDSFCTGLTDATYASGGYPQNCAFATWDKATSFVSTKDFNGHIVTIQAGAEIGVKTWNMTGVLIGSMVTSGPIVGPGASRLQYRGNGSNTVIISSGNLGVFYLQNTLVAVLIGNMQLKSTAAQYGTITVTGSSELFFGDPGPIFDTSNSAHVWVHDPAASAWNLVVPYSIVGGAQWHLVASDGGIIFDEFNTVSVAGGGVAFTTYASAVGGIIQSTGNTWTGGAVTGQKFSATANGTINTKTAGKNYLPGTIAGSMCKGGLFVDENVPCGTWTPADASGAGLVLTNLASVYSTPASYFIDVQTFVTYPVTADGSAAKISGIPVVPAGGSICRVSAAGNVQYQGALTGATASIYTLAGAAVTNATLSGQTLSMLCHYAAS